MRFKYSAKTKDGRVTRKGEIEAPNQKSAIDLLHEKNLIVYSLVPISTRANPLARLSGLKGVSLNDKVKFTEQLSSMVSAGLPLTKALDILTTQTKGKAMTEIINEVLNDVEAGTSLSASLGKHKKAFSENYISLVKAGESSGKLDKVLERLADTLEKQRKFRSKIKGALIYPIIIVSAMIVVFALIIVLVIPKMAVMYKSLNIDLPFATRALIAISDFLINSWWVVLLIMIAIFYSFKFFKNTSYGESLLARISLSFPVFGNLNRQAGLVEFTRTLGLLIESGVPIIDGLEIVQNTTTNKIYRDAIKEFITDVKHGYPLSQAVQKEKYFPPLVPNMLVVGEETGSISNSLTSLSTYFESEVDKIVKNLSTAMEPMIMIMLGIMVALLIISVITPIYQLTSQF